MEWLVKNYEWVFSGIGVAVLMLFFARTGIKQSVKNSSNVTHIGGNVNVGESDGDRTSVNHSENVVQVAGNVTINNYDFAVHEVQELAKIFMRENFPVLREEAIAAASANVHQLLSKFKEKLFQNIGHIDLNRFRDPDIQSSLNDVVLETAKKGVRSNYNILIELVIERLNTGTNDYVSLVVSEAIKVVPKLTQEQLGFLTLGLFMNSSKVTSATSLEDLNSLAIAVLQTSQSSFGLSDSQKSHLEFAGCASIFQPFWYPAHTIWKANYDFLKDISGEELKKTIETHFPALHQMAMGLDDKRLGRISLTSVGKVIGLANLSQQVSDLKYANWLS